MKNFYITLAILIVGAIAIADTKARINELEDIAANTPVQVEMKKDLNKSVGQGVQTKIEDVQTQKKIDNQRFDNMINTPKEMPRTLPPQTPQTLQAPQTLQTPAKP